MNSEFQTGFPEAPARLSSHVIGPHSVRGKEKMTALFPFRTAGKKSDYRVHVSSSVIPLPVVRWKSGDGRVTRKPGVHSAAAEMRERESSLQGGSWELTPESYPLVPWPSQATTHTRYYLNNLNLHCKKWLGYIVIQTVGGNWGHEVAWWLGGKEICPCKWCMAPNCLLGSLGWWKWQTAHSLGRERKGTVHLPGCDWQWHFSEC